MSKSVEELQKEEAKRQARERIFANKAKREGANATIRSADTTIRSADKAIKMYDQIIETNTQKVAENFKVIDQQLKAGRQIATTYLERLESQQAIAAGVPGRK